MVERFEHQLAARAQPGRGAERAVPVQHRGDDAPIVDPEPGAARRAGRARPTTSARSGQCRAGGFAGRSIISSRLAPMMTGQACSGRRRITRVHIASSADAAILRRADAVVASSPRAYGHGMGTTMTIFDERERDFEARYKHDQELQFKVKARRNRLLGHVGGRADGA